MTSNWSGGAAVPPTSDSERRFDAEIAELTSQTRRLTNQAHRLSLGIELTLEQLLDFSRDLEILSSHFARRWDDVQSAHGTPSDEPGTEGETHAR